MTMHNILNMIGKKDIYKRYILLIIATFLAATTFNLLLAPNDIVAGGVNGISIITKDVIQPSTLILISSVILIIISYFTLGRNQTVATVFGSILYPIAIMITSGITNIIKIETNDLFLISIVVGISSGIASGLVFKYGFSLGGTDIIKQILSKYLKISLGTSMIFTDGLIILVGGFFFGWTRMLYALIIIYIASIIADKIILGISESKAFYIVTSKEEQVKKFIFDALHLSVTVIYGQGGYGGEDKKVLLCVIPTKDYFKFKEGLAFIDDNAFFVVTDAYEVVGGTRNE